MSEKIGFVGVGRMGANMARRLKDCDYDIVAVYDSFAESASSLAAEIGARHCHTLSEVTELSDIIFTVVTDDAAMLEMMGNVELPEHHIIHCRQNVKAMLGIPDETIAGDDSG